MIFKVEGPGLFDRLPTVAAVGMYGGYADSQGKVPGIPWKSGSLSR